MGEFANDAVWASMDAEFDRDSYRDQHNREPYAMFDMGCFDHDSLLKDYQTSDLLLATFELSDNDNTPQEPSKRSNPFSDKAKFLKLTTWEMRYGMAKQVMIGRKLSEKQKRWMETNWHKGADDFEKFFTDDPKRFHALHLLETIVKKIYQICQREDIYV